jgi:DNA-binding transcriptional LysR family regulator
MTLDVRSATILLECARGGSLGRAAATLNITQPAVTRALKQLEESYGVPLFERTTRGVVPTVYGEALLPYAQLVVSEIGNAADIIRQMR